MQKKEKSQTEKAKTTKKLRSKFRRYSLILWALFIGAVLSVFLLFYAVSEGYLGYMPSFEELENPDVKLASEVVSADGKVLGKFYEENRTGVEYDEINKHVIQALIATEDERFRDHSGIDFRSVGRAIAGVLTGKFKGGGSTISQQLAKLIYSEKSHSVFSRVIQKLNEWVIAVKVEKRYSKDEIITMYLNKFDFLYNAIGINSAAKIYFSKTPDSLSIIESATLVGMIKNPYYYNPKIHPKRGLNRRNVVLGQMLRNKFISQAEFDSLKTLPLDMSGFKRESHIAGLAPYFREYVRVFMKDWVKNNLKPDGTEYDIYRDGLKIYTTIDSRMQKYAEEAVREHLGGELQDAFYKNWKGRKYAPFYFKHNPEKEIKKMMTQSMKRSERYRHLKKAGLDFDSIQSIFNIPTPMTLFSWKGDIDTTMTPMDSIRYYKYILHSGLIAVEPETGFVKAYVGGIDYRYFKYDHVTQGKRQVGSTFKPILYTLAMQNGMTPCDELPNVQPVITLPEGKTWEPKNATKEEDIGKNISLKKALATSNNWISAQLIDRFSPQPVAKLAHKMGIESEIPEVHSIALGSVDLRLEEIVRAMNTFPSKGISVKPMYITHIADKYGNIIGSFVPEQNEAFDERTAYLMLDLMQGVVQYGTGVRLRLKYGLKNPIAGKTGTTNNHSDGYFMGIVPQLTTGVWVGCDDRAAHFRNIHLGQGANMALPIWALFMKRVYADKSLHFEKENFSKPTIPLKVNLDCEADHESANSSSTPVDEEF
jgi:penicillin-binding protein 1A